MKFIEQLTYLSRTLPVILQSERSECGLACLLMLSNFYGLKANINYFRRHYPMEAGGASVNQLLSLACKLNMEGRAVRLELDELRQLRLPAILHWDLDHFVVLKSLNRRGLVIHDPAVGRRHYSIREAGVHITGVAIELWPAVSFTRGHLSDSPKMASLLGSTDRYYASAAKIFLLSLCIQLLALVSPFYIQLLIDDGLKNLDTIVITALAGLFLCISLLKTALTYLRGQTLLGFSAALGFQMVSGVFRHMLSLPVCFFESKQLGDLVSRFTSLDNIRKLITGEMISVLVDGVFSVVSLILLYRLHSQLTQLMSVFIGTYVVIRFISLGWEKTQRQLLIIEEAGQKSQLIENVRGISGIKTCGIQEQRIQDWINCHASVTNSALQLGQFQNRTQALQNILFGIDHIVTLYIGVLQVQEDVLTIGTLMAFIFLKQHFIASVSAMIPKLVELKLLHIELERITEITSQTVEQQKSLIPILSASVRGELEVQHLYFRYPGTSEYIIADLCFTLRPGQTCVIAGSSGSGKTTLLKLILGLNNPEQGNILIDGFKRNTAGLECVRDKVSAVMQNDCIFTGSLHYNITLDIDTGNTERLEKACVTAQMLGDILSLPMGFETPLSELGSCLSTGQLQRLLLARALYRQPQLLILDEALSHLQAALAFAIIQSIQQQGISLILVTHEEGLARLADFEVVLKRRSNQQGRGGQS